MRTMIIMVLALGAVGIGNAGERFDSIRVLQQGQPMAISVIHDDDSVLLVVESDSKGVSVRVPDGSPVPTVQSRPWGAELIAPSGWSFGPGQCIPDVILHCSPAGCFCDYPVAGEWCDSERQFVNETATAGFDYAGC